jgi:phenol 2-monooxygenase
MRPYSIDVKQVVWWSIYEIGHRLTDRFDDAAEGQGRAPRVFTAGDACHTHSPKAGQGMNVSMQDSFNLGWKLAHVLTGRADESLLRSYSAERWVEAKRLIDTDHAWARIMSAPPGTSDLDGGDLPRFARAFVENLEFTGGNAVHYEQSALTGGAEYQELAAGLTIGKRFHSAPVVRVADARPLHLGHVAEADGRWRIYAFAPEGDRGAPGGPLAALCDGLLTDPASPVLRHTRLPDEDIDAIIDLRAVFPYRFDALAPDAMPALLRPEKGRFGLRDHEKVFCVDHKGQGDIYDLRGIDRARGCMVVVRPDQYVAHVLPLDAIAELSRFFSGVLRVVPRA